MAFINSFFHIILFLISVPIFVLAVETFSAILANDSRRHSLSGKIPRIAVIVPAHNEETVIAATLHSILPQLHPADKILVVADNCDDGTAAVAVSMGAEVLERKDIHHFGKGYALDRGVAALESDPPDVVVFMDADVTAEQNSLRNIAVSAFQTGLPVQSAYLLKSSGNNDALSRLSAFAFCFKNYIRPLGLHNLGLPCLLTGSGMAIPWSLIHAAPLASGNIVEDMQLGIDLAIAGHSPRFCPDALVNGEIPPSAEAARNQWKRWGYGHLNTILSQVPRLLIQSIKQGRIDLLGLSLELLIPPLTSLIVIWLIMISLLFFFAILNLSQWYLIIGASGSGMILVLTILMGWFNFGRDILPFRALLTAPLYTFLKLPIYCGFLKNPEKKWIKTKRENKVSDSKFKQNQEQK